MSGNLENYRASFRFTAFFSIISGLVLGVDVVKTEIPGDHLGACWTVSSRSRRVSLRDFVDADMFRWRCYLDGTIVGVIQYITSNRIGFS